MTQQAQSVEPIIKYSANSTDVRICYKSSRAISTIEKMANGLYRVVKLYEGEVQDCDNYTIAREVAKNAAMTQAPRTRKQEQAA